MPEMLKSTLARPAAPLASFATWTLAVCSVYMWGLPMWSWIGNDLMGFGADLCELDAKDVVCVNHDNYTELAVHLGRRRPDGTYWGCSCGEGVVSDWACNPPMHAFGLKAYFWSVSYYIGTPPATGAFAFVLGWPIAFSWLYGCGNTVTMGQLLNGVSYEDRRLQQNMLIYTQATFHFFLGCILMCTWCVFPNLHLTVTLICCGALGLHFLVLATVVPKTCWQGKAIFYVTLAVLAVLCSVLPYSFAVPYFFEVTWLSLHAFWMCESLCFTIALGTPVVLMWMPPVKGAEDAMPMMQRLQQAAA